MFAINGDYYGFRDTGHRDPQRRGLPRRRVPGPGLAIYRDGTMVVYDETATTAEQLVADGVWNTLSFGPALLDDGAGPGRASTTSRSTPTSATTRSRASSRAPAVGMIAANHFVFVVVDGRSPGLQPRASR